MQDNVVARNTKTGTNIASEFKFKKPLPVKKKELKVLDEDTYLQEIDRIIQRDFFPDLEKVKIQNAYLDAVKEGDVSTLQKIYKKCTLASPISIIGSVRSSFDTPQQDDVPKFDETIHSSPSGSVYSVESSLENNKGAEHSLDSFLSKHTSEDNQNFEELMEVHKHRLMAKHPWLFKENSEPENCSAKSMRTEGDEKASIKDREMPNTLETWDYKDRNYIMFVPDGVELSPQQKIELAKQKQEIVHSNTRLSSLPFDEQQNREALQQIAQMQALALRGKIGVDGREIISETPRVNGFRFLKSPTPSLGPDESPLMTWGQIEGTPFKLDGSDTPRTPNLPGPKFKIAEPPKREKLAHKLADKAGTGYRNKKLKALEAAKRQLIASSPHLKSPLDKASALSPAAKRLISCHLQKSGKSDTSLRSSYTPKGMNSPCAPVLSSSPKSQRTPKISLESPVTTMKRNKPVTPKQFINDSVIIQKKRPKASDYF